LADIRISSAERDDAVTALAVHRSSGRLTHDDHSDRLRRAQQATTREEIEALFDDLPAPHPDLSGAVSPRPPAVVNPEWPGGRVGTRASRVMDVIGVLSLLAGLPLAIIFTAVAGAWWTFLLVLGVGIAAMVLGVAFMAQPAQVALPEENGDGLPGESPG
jgi:hypothetical protein